MMKLACVNCGAGLEITTDLDVFACSYCGSQQRVERKGGIVSLRKVETAIKAVQRGTDRTAAELALPRLQRELTEIETQRAALLAKDDERLRGARRGRSYLVLGIFLVMMMGMGPVAKSNSVVVALAYLVALFAIPIFVFRKVKIAADARPQINADFNERAERIRQHIRSNRAILDELP